MEEELYGGIWSGKKPTVVYPCFYILMEKHKEMLGFNVTQYYFRNNSEVHGHCTLAHEGYLEWGDKKSRPSGSRRNAAQCRRRYFWPLFRAEC